MPFELAKFLVIHSSLLVGRDIFDSAVAFRFLQTIYVFNEFHLSVSEEPRRTAWAIEFLKDWNFGISSEEVFKCRECYCLFILLVLHQ